MKAVSLEQLSTLKPDRAWVTDADQSVIVVSDPKVVEGTLVGYVGGKYERMPSAEVKLVRVETSAPTRTALLAVGIAAGVGGVLVAARTADARTHIVSATPGDCNKYPSELECR